MPSPYAPNRSDLPGPKKKKSGPCRARRGGGCRALPGPPPKPAANLAADLAPMRLTRQNRANLPGQTFPKSTPKQVHPAPPPCQWPSRPICKLPCAKKFKCKLLTDQTYPAKCFRILLQGKLTRRLRPASGPLRHARQPPLGKKVKGQIAVRPNLPGKLLSNFAPRPTHPAPLPYHRPTEAACQPLPSDKSKAHLLADQTYPARTPRQRSRPSLPGS